MKNGLNGLVILGIYFIFLSIAIAVSLKKNKENKGINFLEIGIIIIMWTLFLLAAFVLLKQIKSFN